MNEEKKTGSATYSPEDNKLRLYVGRVSREEFLKLRAEGWITLHKQREAGGGDFAATWTPARRDTALQYAEIIEDEDMSPAERAADRAERFGGYRDARTEDATGHADRYDAGPRAHGYQSEARAVRAADRHDRIAGRAVDAWGKAEYWQRRTAGVIRHALHKAAPGVRMGRIKTIEAEIRKIDKDREEYIARFKNWKLIEAIEDHEKQTRIARQYAGGFGDPYSHDYQHPRNPARKGSLWDLMREDPERNPDPITGAEAAALYLADRTDPAADSWHDTNAGQWRKHLELRIAYEWQMIDAQGGRAATVEMQPGGWLGKHQIRKVNKSPATGRVVSVTLKIPGDRWGNSNEGFHLRAFNVERLPADSYRPPTPEDLASLTETKAKEKAAAPKKADCPLINPTPEDAAKLQTLWNEKNRNRAHCKNPSQVLACTFEEYARRGGTVITVCETGDEHRSRYGRNLTRCDVFKVRAVWGGETYAARRVVVLTDKAQKTVPFDRVAAAMAMQPTPEKMIPKLPELRALLLALQDYRSTTPEENALLSDFDYIGFINTECSRPQWTDRGMAALQAFEKANKAQGVAA